MKQSKLLQNMLQGAGLGAAAFMIVGASTDAFAGISNTKHNLTAGGNTNRVTAGGPTNEVCVFCHTPHGSETAAPVPLWNKRIAAVTYTTYEAINSSSIDGKMTAIGSVSLACLSCHDGTQAMDNVINAPNSGGLTTDGGSTNGLNYTWNTTANGVDSNGRLQGATNAALLGADLKNDHPIGIEYCGGFTAAGNPAACNDKDFNLATKIAGASASADRFYVDTNSSSSRDKSDMILFTRQFPTTGWAPSVECATCHDPHAERKNTNEVAFLRVSQTGGSASGVCLACHVK